MTDILHLGCGDDHRENAMNVDVNPESAADVVADLSDTPWTFANDSGFRRIEAHHIIEHLPDRPTFFAEAARVLEPGGELIVTLPLGRNAFTDDDHDAYWTYGTPEQYCRANGRPWDPNPPFTLVNRDLTVWLGGPLAKASPLFRLLATKWPDWAAYRCFAGEITATYQREETEQ